MICENKNLIFIALQIVASSLRDFNNSQKLLIVSLILSLGRDYFLRKKGYRVSLANFGLRIIKMIFVSHIIRRILT